MSTVEQALGGSEIEVVAKATRRRFIRDYKRKIVREADGCKTPGAVLLQGALSHLTRCRKARERGNLADRAVKKRGLVPRVLNPRDRRIAEEGSLWRSVYLTGSPARRRVTLSPERAA